MMLSLFSVGALVASLFVSNPASAPAEAPIDNSRAFFSTGWEEVSQWTRTVSGNDVVYHFNRNTPELEKQTLKNGAVVVFVKGYDFTGFSKAEKPLGLPFYFMAPEEASGTYNWHTQSREGNINIALQIQGASEESFLKANEQIRIRYFILSPQFLKEHKLNAQSLRGISYTKLALLLGITPQA